MFIRMIVTAALVATVATSAALAAPSKPGVTDEKTYNRWLEIFRPGDLVGPEVDPDNPLHIADDVAFDPQPEPPEAEVVIIAVKR